MSVAVSPDGMGTGGWEVPDVPDEDASDAPEDRRAGRGGGESCRKAMICVAPCFALLPIELVEFHNLIAMRQMYGEI